MSYERGPQPGPIGDALIGVSNARTACEAVSRRLLSVTSRLNNKRLDQAETELLEVDHLLTELWNARSDIANAIFRAGVISGSVIPKVQP